MGSLSTKHILFLGEQDGTVEQKLKTELALSLSSFAEIRAAYLARVSYAEIPGVNVALCLWGGDEKAADVVESAGLIFKSLFKATEHFDTVFLLESQLRSIEKIAMPFYTSSKKQT